ncbi:MAG TPA: tRNA pseudouridine(55) synthase TruB, partial [Polyangiaceae bacterium]|nr:tRNA pseudouridine(55) synthase TruB [Polyangiaceae bacterium]
TLDPAASGVLVLMFGEAKKLSNYLTAQTKAYVADVSFGRSTDSLDAAGATVVEQALPADWPPLDELTAAMARERARTLQVPPQVSAIKLGGRPAHRRVRAGEAVELAARPVQVDELELLELRGSAARFALSVSKGYYVRAFARDLGERLGVPAHLSGLRRTRSGAWTLANAIAWPPTWEKTSEPAPLIATADAASACLPSVSLTPEGVLRARQGKVLRDSDFSDPPLGAAVSAWFDPEHRLVAVGHCDEPGAFRVLRGFRMS